MINETDPRIVAKLFRGLRRGREAAIKHLGPIIEERRMSMEENGKEIPENVFAYLI